MSKCETWLDLPPKYRKVYFRESLRYVSSRMYVSNQAARQAAFEDVRKLMWDAEKPQSKSDSAKLFGNS